MEIKFRCNCPFTSALDILGDKWMLVIIKQMLIENKETFKDFTESDEGIATNILATKLKQLEEFVLITKSKLPTNKKSVYYHLTEKALELTPLIIELGIWSDKHLREVHPTMGNNESVEFLRNDKAGFGSMLIENYIEKLAKTKN
ncbi:helix-turn-helix transcriptional regulator [Polaribacter litorisediminis]|uniref:winged helix-turn-helix transcriptional regulator n=1 Tax=Polaribacter litorisediminis TaxID=1908341 RepID=UPI001CBACCA8|nr:helix-turn-helix domain-containing protein [Polaribacter litorisediminis]UAM97238.1 helix-turn-helix transcriptional regulator [Polaribacter litorisediminis]